MKKEISEAPSGPGATYYWVGNDSVGEGRLTITDSRAALRAVHVNPLEVMRSE